MSLALRQRWHRWQARRMPSGPRIVLDQPRIYIVPNRAGLSWMVLLLLMLLAAINYQNSMAYALTFLLAAVFVVAILHTFRNLSGLVVSAGDAQPVFVGEQARFGLRLESTRRPHHGVGAGWSRAQMQYCDIAPGHVETLELTLPATVRGWLPAPAVQVLTRFPLGMLTAWSWLQPGQRALVYPRPLAGPLPTLARPGDSSDPAVERLHGPGVDDFQGLRPYAPGDSWRRLHWKAWSRGDGLLIKDFADHASEELSLDFQAMQGDVEQRLGRLCYWVLALSREQRVFGLRLPGLELPRDSGDAHRDQCLQALALFGLAKPQPMPQAMSQAVP